MTTCTSSMKSRRMFECKTCNRQFPSFQALGGHRASHRKSRHAGFIETQAPLEPTKAHVHECSVCGVEFALGQALGGHMRRHRTDGHHSGNNDNVRKLVVWGLNLDLNLAPPGEEAEAEREGVCGRQEEEEEEGIDLELHLELELDLAEKVRFVE